jgi:hypothetical protein
MKAYYTPLLAVFTAHLYGTPTLGTVSATPTTAVAGSPTQISVQASITDTSLITGGANLLQLNPNGTTTILGTLHDDGLNGDAYAGDLIFTLVVTLNAPVASQIQLQVSAAFKGVLQRVKSPVVNVFFQPANAPQQSIAALAQYLTAGNTSAASNYVGPSYSSSLGGLSQPGLNILAAIISAGVLVNSQNDLRIFQSPFIAPDGTATTVEFSMVPGPNGQWVINAW